MDIKIDQKNKGLLYGSLGIAAFSLTLPATKVAVQYLDPFFIGLGRALVASLLALIIILVNKEKLPPVSTYKSFAIVSLGVIIGFPLLSSWALQYVPASHGAVMLGITPLFTAIAGTIRAGERPSLLFWILSIVGSAIVVTYAIITGSGKLHPADFALLVAIIIVAFGYAEGGKLSQEMGGRKVISWALVFSAPFIVLPVVYIIINKGVHASAIAWGCFGYVSIISQFLGFFVWYKGLAMGGIAKVGQVQLLQPFLTLIISSIFLGEAITPLAIVTIILVVLTVVGGRKANVKRSAAYALKS